MRKKVDFLFIEKQDDQYTISMTPELQEDVGDVGFVEFTTADTVKADEMIANLESAKTIVELNSPIDGEITERNQAVIHDPALLSSDNPEENWIIKLTNIDEDIFNALEDA